MEKRLQVIALATAIFASVSGCGGSAKQKIVQGDNQPAIASTVEASNGGRFKPSKPTQATVTGAVDGAASIEPEVPGSDPEPSIKPASERITALKPPTIRPAVMPEVVLTDAHASDCMVRVGDEFPLFRLPDLSGRARALEDVRGDLLTVVAFWSSDRVLTVNLLDFLDQRIAAYADLGVKVVAINVGEEPTQVKRFTHGEDPIAVLLDPAARLFSLVGRGHLPRVYLLDRAGRVLWFDIEFSRHTREQLEQAIQASLKST